MTESHLYTQTYGTLAYMPPELLSEGKLTQSVDVYSFAIIMYAAALLLLCTQYPCACHCCACHCCMLWGSVSQLCHKLRKGGKKRNPPPRTHPLPPCTRHTRRWELYCASEPFPSSTVGQVFYAVVCNGQRPQIPSQCPAGYAALVRACWAPEPEDRCAVLAACVYGVVCLRFCVWGWVCIGNGAAAGCTCACCAVCCDAVVAPYSVSRLLQLLTIVHNHTSTTTRPSHIRPTFSTVLNELRAQFRLYAMTRDRTTSWSSAATGAVPPELQPALATQPVTLADPHGAALLNTVCSTFVGACLWPAAACL